MTIGVLVVDDSSFFRQQICKLINSFGDFKVIGTALNGTEAIKKAATLNPGLITMDYEMPGMDGITAVREIMAQKPVPILMLSSLSYDGAKITLDALDAGAADYLLKDFESFAKSTSKTQNELYKRLVALTSTASAKKPAPAALKKERRSEEKASVSTKEKSASLPPSRSSVKLRRPEKLAKLSSFDVLLIGCSTGGPAATTRLLTGVDGNFPLPIVIALHMPEYFTDTFAKRLNSISKLRVKEAEQGDILKRGSVYLAPGGKQLMFDKSNRKQLNVMAHRAELEYAPCVDVLYASAAKDPSRKSLALVLTGMGSDGMEGCKMLKRQGSTVWVQDEASCVVNGMPGAVVKSGSADAVLSLDLLADIFKAGS